MPASGTIAEFLVSLGFKVDQSAQRSAGQAIKGTQQAVGDLQKALDGAAKLLQGLGVQLRTALGGTQAPAAFKGLSQTAQDLHNALQAAAKGAQNVGQSLKNLGGEPAQKFDDARRRLRSGGMELGKIFKDLGVNVAAVGTAFAGQLTEIASRFNELYYIAQRTGGGVGQLAAAQQAGGQIGIGNIPELLNRMAGMMRTNPGLVGLFSAITGIRPPPEMLRTGQMGQNPQEFLFRFLDRLKNMAPYLRDIYGQMFGIAPDVLEQMIANLPILRQEYERAQDIQRRFGLDMTRIGDESVSFWRNLGHIVQDLGGIMLQALQPVLPQINRVLELTDQFLQRVGEYNKEHPWAALLEDLAALAVSLRVAISLSRGLFALLIPGLRGSAAAGTASAAAIEGVGLALKKIPGVGVLRGLTTAFLSLQMGAAVANAKVEDFTEDLKKQQRVWADTLGGTWLGKVFENWNDFLNKLHDRLFGAQSPLEQLDQWLQEHLTSFGDSAGRAFRNFFGPMLGVPPEHGGGGRHTAAGPAMQVTGGGTPEANALLTAIAAHEAHSYNTLYGNGRFSDFSRFPQWGGLPGPKGQSHAAGLYQFEPKTWRDVSRALGLHDFTPASQDKAALALAEQVYRKATGRDILADVRAGALSPLGIQALRSQWPSIGADFGSLLRGSLARQQAGTAFVPGRGNQPLAIGDSIAVGLRRAGSLGGYAISGKDEESVLGFLRSAAGQLRGRNVILSSGASNDPGLIAHQAAQKLQLVKEQLKVLYQAGAHAVLLGVGQGVYHYKEINAKLAQMAREAGVGFTGELPTTEGGRVHPRDYNAVLQGALHAFGTATLGGDQHVHHHGAQNKHATVNQTNNINITTSGNNASEITGSLGPIHRRAAADVLRNTRVALA